MREGDKTIVIISPEVAPFSKGGGLADVAEGLPKALAKLGYRVVVISMLYDSTIEWFFSSDSTDIDKRAEEARKRIEYYGFDLAGNKGQKVFTDDMIREALQHASFEVTSEVMTRDFLKNNVAYVNCAIGGVKDPAYMAFADYEGVELYFIWNPLYSKKMYLGQNIDDYALVAEPIEIREFRRKRRSFEYKNTPTQQLAEYNLLHQKLTDGTLPHVRRGRFQWLEDKLNSELHTITFNQTQFFCKSALEVLIAMNIRPDLIHLHDWQTGMVGLLLEGHLNYRDEAIFANVPVVYSIHNLAYKGLFFKELAEPLAGIYWSEFTPQDAEHHGDWSFAKAGMVREYVDAVITVSPNYRNEILTPEYGEGMDGVLRDIEDILYGVVNGLDYQTFDPRTDPYIAHRFSFENLPQAKVHNKQALRKTLRQMGYSISDPIDPDTPLIGAAARLIPQKGLDIATEAMRHILSTHPEVQFVAVGSSDRINYPKVIQDLEALEYDFPGRVAVHGKFSVPLAQQIFAAQKVCDV